MGVLESLFGIKQKPTPPPPPQRRTRIEDIDNTLRRRHRNLQSQGRSSLISGLNTPKGTGLNLGSGDES